MDSNRGSGVLILLLSIAGLVWAASRSVWDGVYTKDQAQRGQAVYRENCARCHGENLGGGEAGPPLTGEEFLKTWNRRTVGDLFGVVRKTMPSEDPGSLSTREYSDIVAFVFSANEFPAGSKELDREISSLNEIRIEAKR
jgi:quinoprotein glucose dehydrogenase